MINGVEEADNLEVRILEFVSSVCIGITGTSARSRRSRHSAVVRVRKMRLTSSQASLMCQRRSLACKAWLRQKLRLADRPEETAPMFMKGRRDRTRLPLEDIHTCHTYESRERYRFSSHEPSLLYLVHSFA